MDGVSRQTSGSFNYVSFQSLPCVTSTSLNDFIDTDRIREDLYLSPPTSVPQLNYVDCPERLFDLLPLLSPFFLIFYRRYKPQNR